MSRRRNRHAGEPSAGSAEHGAPQDPETTEEPGGLLDHVQQEIAQRAYELYLERAGGSGSDLEDWLRAESDVRGRGR